MELKETEIFRRFEYLGIIGRGPTSEEWEQMESALYEAFPRFRDFMHEHRNQLTDKEHKTCLLIRMGFRPRVISYMLGTSAAYISIARHEMMQKMYGTSGPLRTFDEILQGMM